MEAGTFGVAGTIGAGVADLRCLDSNHTIALSTMDGLIKPIFFKAGATETWLEML
jgi:hypothetical protein